MYTKNKVLVKSGGFSTQLVKYVGEKIEGDPLWSSRFDALKPEAVIRTHLDFLESGAQILLSNTYQSSVDGFMKHLHVSREEAVGLIRHSVKLAKDARERHLKQKRATHATTTTTTTPTDEDQCAPLVIASIGPYGAYLHDYSEYTGSYADKVSVKEIQDWHRPRIVACLAEGVDGLGIETIPCQIEAEAVVDMILSDYPECKFYISFQCKNAKTLANGESFADVVAEIWSKIKSKNATDRCYGLGVNCVNPRNVAALFKSLHAAERGVVPLLVYSNSDEIFNTDTGKWQDNEGRRPLASFVPEWIELGAKIIGGCCRVYPQDILDVRKCVDELQQ